MTWGSDCPQCGQERCRCGSARGEAFLLGAVVGDYGLKVWQTDLFWVGFGCGGLLGLLTICSVGIAIQVMLMG